MARPDRRRTRTRRQLREALLELIPEKGYDDLLIQEITDRADLSRATFYLHFKDKDDLLAASLSDVMEELVASFPLNTLNFGIQANGKIGLLIFQHADEHRALYKALLNERGGHAVMEDVRRTMAQMAESNLRLLLAEREAQMSVPLSVVATYMAGGLFTLLLSWLESDDPEPPEIMAKMFGTMTSGLLGSLLTIPEEL